MNDTMSDDEVVATDVPPRYLFGKTWLESWLKSSFVEVHVPDDNGFDKPNEKWKLWVWDIVLIRFDMPDGRYQ